MKVLVYNDVSLAENYHAGNLNGFISILSWLSTRGDVTVLHTHYRRPMRSLPANIKVVWRPDYFNLIVRHIRARLGCSLPLLKHKDSWFKRWQYCSMVRSDNWDIIIIEYIDNSFLVGSCATPSSTILIADLHDLFSARAESFRDNNVYASENLDINFSEEVKAIDSFDRVLFVQGSEAAKVNTELGKRKALVTRRGPSATLKTTEVGYAPRSVEEPLRIGFIGNISEFNVDAARQMIDVYDDTQNVVFHVAGSVCARLPEAKEFKCIHLLGELSSLDQFYRGIDVAANLVRYGSGIKTKNIEALVCGVPVITTTVGADGLEDFIGKGLFLANNKNEWIKAISEIRSLDDPSRYRWHLAERARAAFDPDVVFYSLNQFIENAISDPESCRVDNA